MTFILALDTLQRRKFMALPSDKNDECRPQLFQRTAVPKIIKGFQQNMGEVVRYWQISLVCYCSFDVLLGIIFNKLQTNNYMTSPTSTILITLNIPRICEESQVAFYFCSDLILTVTYTTCRNVLSLHLEHSRTSLVERFCGKR